MVKECDKIIHCHLILTYYHEKQWTRRNKNFKIKLTEEILTTSGDNDIILMVESKKI